MWSRYWGRNSREAGLNIDTSEDPYTVQSSTSGFIFRKSKILVRCPRPFDISHLIIRNLWNKEIQIYFRLTTFLYQKLDRVWLPCHHLQYGKDILWHLAFRTSDKRIAFEMRFRCRWVFACTEMESSHNLLRSRENLNRALTLL